jgi:Spy/CpxP family protein refolding chaperone
MMKKTLILACALIVATSSVYATETSVQQVSTSQQHQQQNYNRPPKGPDFQKRNAELEQRLKLTDKQKAKAEKLREQSFEKMKPIMDKLQEKKAEIDAVKRSRMSVEMQNEKIAELQKEIGALKNEAHRLRMENMKDFEAILTKKQKKELQKMKEEGRKNFDKEFRKGGQPPFGGGRSGDFPPPPPER